MFPLPYYNVRRSNINLIDFPLKIYLIKQQVTYITNTNSQVANCKVLVLLISQRRVTVTSKSVKLTINVFFLTLIIEVRKKTCGGVTKHRNGMEQNGI